MQRRVKTTSLQVHCEREQRGAAGGGHYTMFAWSWEQINREETRYRKEKARAAESQSYMREREADFRYNLALAGTIHLLY